MGVSTNPLCSAHAWVLEMENVHRWAWLARAVGLRFLTTAYQQRRRAELIAHARQALRRARACNSPLELLAFKEWQLEHRRVRAAREAVSA